MKTEKEEATNNFSELERLEDKYIIDLDDLADIQAEIAKHMKTAYLNSKTKYVIINSIYFDNTYRDFFRMHVYGANERTKVRLRKYAPNGKWEDDIEFMEIKSKDHEDVHKARIQLDENNITRTKAGKKIELTEELEKVNSPLYTFSTLKRFVDKFNNFVDKGIKPVISITYKRLAYGKGSLRVTIDTDISHNTIGVLSLSDSLKIKKSVDWKVVKEYKNKYDPSKNAVLEIKHDSKNLPMWLQDLLAKYDLKSSKFSKYVWSSYSAINMMEKFK